MKVEPAPSPAIAAAVREIERRLHPAAVLVFGSSVAGTTTPASDVDIALLLDRPGVDDASDVGAVASDIEETVGRDVDLVVLDRASPVIVMEVLRGGRLVRCAKPDALERFTVRTLTDYADLKITRRPIEERLLAAGKR